MINSLPAVKPALPFQGLASVWRVVAGRATEVIYQDEKMAVYNQAAHVPYLQRGDEVAYLLLPEGVYIIGRSLQAAEAPSVAFQQVTEETLSLTFGDANWELHHNGDAMLKNSSASFAMTESGAVKCVGQQFHCQVANDVVLQTVAGHIHCNYPEIWDVLSTKDQ